MKVAYLVNQYPAVSHSFIRREIAALETMGLTVERFSIRPPPSTLVDPADLDEATRTRVLLEASLFTLLGAFLGRALRGPKTWWNVLVVTIRLGRRSERGLLRHFAYMAEACLLLKWIRAAQNVTHVHAHFGTNSAAVAMLTHLLGGPPYSFTVHGPEEFDHPEELSLSEKVRRASAVVAVSDFGRSQLYRWTPVEQWSKIHVIRCGVDSRFLAAGPQPVSDSSRLVCVGRLAAQKGQLLLIKALAELTAAGVFCEVVLAGDGPMRAEIEEAVRALELDSRVRITGWVSNDAVRDELLAARALLLPSFAEGLPVVLMEALALGRPVVTTYVAGIPELIQHGINGWLIPAGSVEALVRTIGEVLRTPPAELARMGRAGAAAAAAQHDAGREATRLANLFRPEIEWTLRSSS